MLPKSMRLLEKIGRGWPSRTERRGGEPDAEPIGPGGDPAERHLSPPERGRRPLKRRWGVPRRADRPLRIILNADDFGLSRTINERIAGLLERGCVTSATLLANGPAVEEAARLAARFSRCSFGIHLNLTEGPPLTRSPRLRAILDDRGCFAGNRIRAVRLTSSLRDAVYQEWCAQVERARSLGVPVSHLDSHHHVHTVVGLFGVLKRLQRTFKIGKVRLARNIYGLQKGSAPLLAGKRLWNFALRHCYTTRTTDGFTAFMDFLERLRAGMDFGHGCVELMTHPGAALFEEETRLLEGGWRDEIDRPVELISYGQL